jgi:anti-sigma factor RsiW
MATQCRDIETLFPTYLDGELAPHDQLSFEHHVADCASCRELVRSERNYLERVRALLIPPAPPADLPARVAQTLDREDELAMQDRRRSGWSWLLPGSASVAAAAALVLFALSMFEGRFGGPERAAAGVDQAAPSVREAVPARTLEPSDLPVVSASTAAVRELSQDAEQHLRRRVRAPRLDQVSASVRGSASQWDGRQAYMLVFENVPDSQGTLHQVTVHMLDARYLDLTRSEHFVVPGTGTELWLSTLFGPPIVSYQDRHGMGYVFSSEDMAPADLVGLVIAFGAFTDDR